MATDKEVSGYSTDLTFIVFNIAHPLKHCQMMAIVWVFALFSNETFTAC